MRYEDRRGGESYRPPGRYSRSRSSSRTRRPRSPPPSHGSRYRSPPRLSADTWAPRGGSVSGRYRSRSPVGAFRRSRSPPYRPPPRVRSPQRIRSPRRDRPQSPVRPWRSRSPPYSRASYEQSHRGLGDSSRASYAPRSPRRDRPSIPSPGRRPDISPPPRLSTREREPYGRPQARSRSPYRGGHSPRAGSHVRSRAASPGRLAPSGHASALNSASTSRRSSPPIPNERLRVASSRHDSRSPALDSQSRRSANDDISKSSSLPAPKSPLGSESGNLSSATRLVTDRDLPAGSRSSDRASSPTTKQREHGVSDDHDVPPRQLRATATRNFQDRELPNAPSASNSSSSQNRSSNVSLLSAPTRPRGASSYNSRDPTWSTASNSRRISSTSNTPQAPVAPHAPPTGPRNRYAYNPPAHDINRGPSYRHSSNAPVNHTRTTKPNYLASLPTIVSGGRLLPLAFDLSIEKRLMALKADEEKLIEQAVEKQLQKRQGLRDWERLQRESALNALRSELAEVHLQRMTEEDRLEGSSVF